MTPSPHPSGAPFRARSVLFLLVALWGCDAVAPQRTINEDVAPPTVVAFEALRSDLHYAGELTVRLPGADVPPDADLATLFIDGAAVAECLGPPCDVLIDTAAYPEGPRDLAVTYLPPGGTDPAVGLGALLGLSRVILRDTVVFDQSPPEPVAITETVWTEAGVELRWESPEGANRNARSYRVLPGRHGQQAGDVLRVEAPAAGALDAQFPLRMGDFLTYRVAVTNGVANGTHGATLTAMSPTVGVEASPRIGETRFCGDAIDDPADRYIDFAGVPGDDRLLGLCATPEGTSLRAFTFSTATIGPHAPIDRPDGVSPFGLDLVADPTGRFALIAQTPGVPTRLFAAALDPGSLTAGPWVELESPGVWGLSPSGAAVGPDGRYFVSGYYERIHVFDPATGALLQSLLPERTPGTQRTASRRVGADGLLVTRSPEVYRIDMAANPAVVTAETTVDRFDANAVATDAAGRLYRVRTPDTSRIDVLDPVTLAVERSFGLPGGAHASRLSGGLDGVYVHAFSDVGREIIHIAADGTVLGRRPSVDLDTLHPAPTRGTVFFSNDGRAPSIDTVSR